MSGIFPDIGKPASQSGWKAYQENLKRQNRPTRSARRPRRVFWLAAGIGVVVAAILFRVFSAGGHEDAGGSAAASARIRSAQQAALIDKSDVHILLGDNRLTNPDQQPVAVSFDGRPYQIHTSLDLRLQQYLLNRLDRVNSRYIGIVAMSPHTGRLVAMAGFNKNDPDTDPCLSADYLAASIFKIVTAAAAVEEKGYTAASRFTFNGDKHTLYKRQLTDKTNRYTQSISLKESFAQSVNPVFGKIGGLYLGPQDLETYAHAFAFNRSVDFELPWPVSELTVTQEPYQRAEIASGFNRQTTLSPLHAAVIVSALVNGGRPVEPTLVDRIVDRSGRSVYQSAPRFMPAVVSPQTADVLGQLMNATVVSGTARQIFRGHSRNKVLSRLTLGGKTGSLFNRSRDARFDWFVGFASEKQGSEKLVVAVMVAHEEYIGTRAGQYARMVIEHYFKDYFAKKDQASSAGSSG
jgi:penicillin-binding protein A